MKIKRLTKICEYFCKLLEKREAASVEMISDFISEVEIEIRSGVEKQDFSYNELVDRCKRYQAYEMEDKDRFAYMVGSILGVAEIYQKHCAELKLTKYESDRLSPSSKRFMILRFITEQPGISRKELLNRISDGTTSSALSHITSDLQKRQYISECKLGQEKTFFSTRRGDELVSFWKQQEKQKEEDELAFTDEINNFLKGRNAIRIKSRQTTNQLPIDNFFDDPLQGSLLDMFTNEIGIESIKLIN